LLRGKSNPELPLRMQRLVVGCYCNGDTHEFRIQESRFEVTRPHISSRTGRVCFMGLKLQVGGFVSQKFHNLGMGAKGLVLQKFQDFGNMARQNAVVYPAKGAYSYIHLSNALKLEVVNFDVCNSAEDK